MSEPLSPAVVHELNLMLAEDREHSRFVAQEAGRYQVSQLLGGPLKAEPLPTLAIDPGNTGSAYVVVDADRRPLKFGKLPNEELLELLPGLGDCCGTAVIEMVASYGMAVGAEVFETCVWIGRFQQVLVDRIWQTSDGQVPVHLVKRLPVKIHLCHSSAAKDSNIRQALVDRFALGQPNYGKGTKAAPGWFHGFSADVWAAYALGVYAVDVDLK